MTRALNRVDGVESVHADLETQLVDVTTGDGIDYDTVLATIKKTGKQVIEGKTVS